MFLQTIAQKIKEHYYVFQHDLDFFQRRIHTAMNLHKISVRQLQTKGLEIYGDEKKAPRALIWDLNKLLDWAEIIVLDVGTLRKYPVLPTKGRHMMLLIHGGTDLSEFAEVIDEFESLLIFCCDDISKFEKYNEVSTDKDNMDSDIDLHPLLDIEFDQFFETDDWAQIKNVLVDYGDTKYLLFSDGLAKEVFEHYKLITEYVEHHQELRQMSMDALDLLRG